jgi:chromosome segregation ATPase
VFGIKEQELKTKVLEFEKRIAELGLATEKLRKDFDDVWGIVPQLKGRVEDLETNTDVLILGVSDLKDQLSNLSKELANFRKIYEDDNKAYDGRLQSLKMDVGKAIAAVESAKASTESSMKVLEENLEKDVEMLREIINKAVAQVDLLQKNIDTTNSNVKALQKVVEMTDNSALLKQIDALNVKIVNLNVALEQLKNAIPDTSGLAKDISILNSKIQTVQMNVMDMKNELAEKEKRLALAEIEIDKAKNAAKNSFDNIYERLKEQEEKFIKAKNLDVLANFGLESKKRMKEIETAKIEIEAMYKSMQKMSYDFNKKMYDFAFLKAEVEKLRQEIEKIKTLAERPKKEGYPVEFVKLIDDLKQKVATPDKTLLEIFERIKMIEEKLALLELSAKSETPAIIE